MFKLIILAIFFATSFLFAYWLSFNSGMLTFDILNYKFEMPFVFAICLIFFAILISSLFCILLNKILDFPNRIKNIVDQRNINKTITNLSGFILNYAGNNHKNLLTISNNLCKSSYIDKNIKLAISALSKSFHGIDITETSLLANNLVAKPFIVPKLVLKFLNEKQFIAAIIHAEDLWSFSPSSNSALLLIKAYAANCEWQKIINFTNTFKVRNFIASGLRYDLLSFAYFKQAINYDILNDLTHAEECIVQSIKFSKNLPSAYELAINLYLKANNLKKALNTAEKAWAIYPSIQFAQLIKRMEKSLKPNKFFEKVKLFTAYNSKSYESKLLLAHAAMNNDDFELAFNTLEQAITILNGTRAYSLMAELSIRQGKTNSEVLNWMKFAAQAQNDVQTLSTFDISKI